VFQLTPKIIRIFGGWYATRPSGVLKASRVLLHGLANPKTACSGFDTHHKQHGELRKQDLESFRKDVAKALALKERRIVLMKRKRSSH
jgi:hypothetical protein